MQQLLFELLLDVTDGSTHTLQVHSSLRSPLSGIPVRTAPAAAVSPIQVFTHSVLSSSCEREESVVRSDEVRFVWFLSEAHMHKATIKDAGKKNQSQRVLSSSWYVVMRNPPYSCFAPQR